ncbi:hypothetical protein GCM10010250_21430 [Streptomyces althioticus]|uniref:GIY-YIG nuclease family protein n=1 Tax=Streptomyces althioticus TaxID=83380 RepID=UPI001874FAF4|nr:hypothetical protein GCM10010250_21430 [Streptomyces althioticus]
MIEDQGRHLPVRRFDRHARPKDLLLDREHRSGRHAVYRFYAHAGQPLYIGYSGALGLRLADHRRTSQWWPLAEFFAVSFYPTMTAATVAESAAIRAERPAFNRQRTPERTRMECRFEDGAERIAAEFHRIAPPQLVRELASLLASPELFPDEVPPPAPRFEDLTVDHGSLPEVDAPSSGPQRDGEEAP